MGNTNTRLRSKSILGRSKIQNLLATLLVVTFCSTTALAATINVNSTQDRVNAGDGQCTLREAINNSNNDNDTTGGDCTAGNASPDTINVPAGTYRISISGNDENGNATGDFDITDDVNIFGVQGAEAIIQGPNNDRIFEVRSGSDATFRDLIIKGGNATNNTSGGGIFGSGCGTLTLTRVTLTENDADLHGGAIAASCGLMIEDSLFTKNAANKSGGNVGNGGTIFHNGVSENIVIEDSIIGGIPGASNQSDGNTAANGGGISISGVSNVLVINGSTIAGNQAILTGGGIHLSGIGAMATLGNNTISGNSARGNGGGLMFIAAGSPVLILVNNTITNNKADSDANGVGTSGGMFVGAPDQQYRNNIIAGNSAAFFPDCSLTLDASPSLGNNLIGNNSGCGEFPSGIPNGNGDFVGTPDNPIDPNLAALAIVFPGTTPVHLPESDSLALDNGDGTGCANAPINNVDQRGITRPQQVNGVLECDIGAVELQRVEQFATTQSIRVSTGFNVPFHCGQERITFTNGGDQVEMIEQSETIIIVTFPETRVVTNVSTRDQAQIVQSATLVAPANFMAQGVMSPFILVTMNPGKSYRITCADLLKYPATLSGDGSINEIIEDILAAPEDFFQGVLTIESSNSVTVTAKKIKRTWVINDAGSTPAYSDGEESTSLTTFTSFRASGSRLVNFFVSSTGLPTTAASVSNQAYGPPLPSKLKPVIQVNNQIGSRSIEFRAQGQNSGVIGVQIYSLNGREVYAADEIGSSLKWNLRDKNSRPVANGVYFYVVTMRGPDGNLIRTDIKKLIVLR